MRRILVGLTLTISTLYFLSFKQVNAADIGHTLSCFATYSLNFKEGVDSKTRDLTLTDSTEGIKKESVLNWFDIDLDHMNTERKDMASPLYARLIPDQKDSDSVIDISISPTYSGEIKPGRLSTVTIHIGQAKKDSVKIGGPEGVIESGFEATRYRVLGHTYDGLYYTSVSVGLSLVPETHLQINLPSMNAGIQTIYLGCMLK